MASSCPTCRSPWAAAGAGRPLLVLIYFIHHVATSIQLPWVIAGIAADLRQAVELELPTEADAFVPGAAPATDAALGGREPGCEVPAATSGYLQYVSQRRLVTVADRHDAVIELIHRPGHFVSAGRPLARVSPAEPPSAFVTDELRSARHRPPAHPAPGPGLRHRPAGRDRHPGAVTGGQRHVHRPVVHRLAGRRAGRDHPTLGQPPPGLSRRGRHRCASSRRASATSGWSTGPTTRSARPAAGCRRS